MFKWFQSEFSNVRTNSTKIVLKAPKGAQSVLSLILQRFVKSRTIGEVVREVQIEREEGWGGEELRHNASAHPQSTQPVRRKKRYHLLRKRKRNFHKRL